MGETYGGEVVGKVLKEEGVKYFFGVQGAHLWGLLPGICEQDIQMCCQSAIWCDLLTKRGIMCERTSTTSLSYWEITETTTQTGLENSCREVKIWNSKFKSKVICF